MSANVRWRQIVNPIDWIAWVYGKWFAPHAIIGACAFCTFAVVVMLFLYLRALDKYTEEHSKALTPPMIQVPAPKQYDKEMVEQHEVHADAKVAVAHPLEPEVRIVEQKELSSSPYPAGLHALQVTVAASRTIQPVHLRLECDKPLQNVDLSEPIRLIQYSYGVIPSEPNVAEVTFQFPPMDQNHPVVIVLLSLEPVKVLSVRNVK